MSEKRTFVCPDCGWVVTDPEAVAIEFCYRCHRTRLRKLLATLPLWVLVLTRTVGRLLFRVSPGHRRDDEVQHNQAMIEDLIRERRGRRR